MQAAWLSALPLAAPKASCSNPSLCLNLTLLQVMGALTGTGRTSRTWWALTLTIALVAAACQPAAAAAGSDFDAAIPVALDWLQEPAGGWTVWDVPADALRGWARPDGVRSAASGGGDSSSRHRAKSQASQSCSLR